MMRQRREARHRRQQQRQESRRQQELGRRWAQEWAAVGLGGSRTPALIETKDAPLGRDDLTAPTVRHLLFVLPAGVVFSDIEEVLDRLGNSIGRNMMLAEMWQLCDTDRPAARRVVVMVSHELVDLPDVWHLSPGLDNETLEFGMRWAVVSAMRSLGFATPGFSSAERLSVCAPMLMMSMWKLGGSDTCADVAAKAETLQRLLRCDWLRVQQYRDTSYVVLVFGAHPNDVTLRRPGRLLRADLAAIDWGDHASNGPQPGLIDAAALAAGLPHSGRWAYDHRAIISG